LDEKIWRFLTFEFPSQKRTQDVSTSFSEKNSKTYNAYMRWNEANDLVSNIMSDRSRAQLQADMPEYETYLPMFGEPGIKLLEKLRLSISSVNHPDTTDND